MANFLGDFYRGRRKASNGITHGVTIRTGKDGSTVYSIGGAFGDVNGPQAPSDPRAALIAELMAQKQARLNNK